MIQYKTEVTGFLCKGLYFHHQLARLLQILNVKFHGGKSREKVVKILVSVTPDEILEKLKKEASS
uniref:Uncharacterized protein n=1 Tax=Bubo bubo TaxID=30461 RepID=A0A8C0EL11_BUBBB